MTDATYAVLNECLESFANLFKKKKGECLNHLGDTCQCTVCKINKVLKDEAGDGSFQDILNGLEMPPIGSSETGWAIPTGQEGLDLSAVYKLYSKIVCVDQWYQPGSGWTSRLPANNQNYSTHNDGLYMEPYGLNFVLRTIKNMGGTYVQFRCLNANKELCYPDFKISELNIQ